VLFVGNCVPPQRPRPSIRNIDQEQPRINRAEDAEDYFAGKHEGHEVYFTAWTARSSSSSRPAATPARVRETGMVG